MLVATILGLLVTIAGSEMQSYVMHARRTEAIAGLEALWTAQRSALADRGEYASTFSQLAEFEITGGKQVTATEYQGQRYTYQLTRPWGPGSFYCIATAQLDSDPWPDIIEIYALPGE